ncbi:MAG: MgtC/SapB family protein, partial [Holophagales bacterium]|nr:MgtC/SapB family protein [Holophagales bacterium]
MALPVPEPVLRFAFAFGVGLLVGLQREWSDSKLAGVRTFPLIALFGAVAALLAATFGGTLVAVGVAAVAGLAALGNWMKLSTGQPSPGLTTEVSMLLTFGLGAYSMVGELVHVAVIGGATVVLLQSKDPLHRAIDRLGERDFRAIVQFVLISLVMLPVIPDRTFGPFAVLNLREVWWMV